MRSTARQCVVGCRCFELRTNPMRRRDFIALLGGAAAFWPLRLDAQERIWRIGMLDTSSLQANAVNYAAFVKALRELGYVEQQNTKISYRSAEGDPTRFTGLAKELVDLGADVMLTRGTPAALAVKNYSSSTPVVMVST